MKSGERIVFVFEGIEEGGGILNSCFTLSYDH